MKIFVLLTICTLFCTSFIDIEKMAEKCSDWIPAATEGRESKLYLKTCEYESGGSGYLQIKNDNNKEVRLTYVINFKNGKSTRGSTAVPANGQTSGSSCIYCAVKNGGGISSWRFENIVFEGDVKKPSESKDGNYSKETETKAVSNNPQKTTTYTTTNNNSTTYNPTQSNSTTTANSSSRTTTTSTTKSDAERYNDLIKKQQQDKQNWNNLNNKVTEFATQIGGGTAAERKAKREREEAREEAKEKAIYDEQQRKYNEQQRKWQAAKEEELRKKEEEKERLENLSANRLLLFQDFPDGTIPLTSQKIEATELYYFAYSVDKDGLQNDGLNISITNVFVVTKRSDNTWPFKSIIINDLKKSAIETVTIVGYYTSFQEAENELKNFKRRALNNNLIIQNITYKGKKATVSNSEDFWGNAVKTTPSNTQKKTETKPSATKANSKKTPTTKDNFWNN